MNPTEKILLAGLSTVIAAPALAGTPNTPAPIAGIGIGAVLLVGVGYRALKRRIRH